MVGSRSENGQDEHDRQHENRLRYSPYSNSFPVSVNLLSLCPLHLFPLTIFCWTVLSLTEIRFPPPDVSRWTSGFHGANSSGNSGLMRRVPRFSQCGGYRSSRWRREWFPNFTYHEDYVDLFHETAGWGKVRANTLLFFPLSSSPWMISPLLLSRN